MHEETIAIILQRLQSIEDELNKIDATYIRSDLIEERNRSQGERIGHLELMVQSLNDDKKWFVRIVLGVIIMAVIGVASGELAQFG